MRRHRYRNQKQRQEKKKKVRWTGRISDHFSKKDFSFTDAEGKEKLRISMGLVGGLELLRSKAGKRVNIVKGYITQEEAEKERNWKRNYHPTGLAAEITVDDVEPRRVFLLAEEVPEFMGLGLDLDKQCVHVDTRKGDERVLWVIENGKETPMDASIRERIFAGMDAPSEEANTPNDTDA